MANWKSRITVEQQPNLYIEAVNLLYAYAEWVNDPDSAEDFAEVHIVQEQGSFVQPVSEIDKRFSDVIGFQTACRQAALPLLEEAGPLLPFCTLQIESPTGWYGYLIDSLKATNCTTSGELSKDELLTGLASTLVQQGELSDPADEEQWAQTNKSFQRLARADYSLSDVLTTLGQSYYDDSAQMMILRFYRDLDDLFELLLSIVHGLESIIQQEWPKVADRFEQKTSALRAPDTLARELSVTDDFVGKIDNFRPDDPIRLWVSVMNSRTIEMRFSDITELDLRIVSGLLVFDLDALRDEQQARAMRTQQQLKAVSDPTRFRVVTQLALRPQYVQELADNVELTSATLSHHLGILQQARLVRTSAEGRRAYYSLNEEELSELAHYIESLSHSAAQANAESAIK